MNKQEKRIEQLKRIIKSSSHLVCAVGEMMHVENGYPMLQDSDWTYDMEMKYGDSPEEILSASFYATRTEQFFEFYRNELLSCNIEPNEAYRALAQLERQGDIKSIISSEIYSLSKVAGCKNVIELSGSIYNNSCSHCWENYDISVVRNSKKVPICPKCNRIIRPGVFLFGEMIDNQIMTRAMEEISRADTLMICGDNLYSPNVDSCLQYFNGNKIIVINEKPHFSDEKAYLVINDKVMNILPKVL